MSFPTTKSRQLLRLSSATAVALCSAIAFSGCGSSSSKTGDASADPAKAVPQTAPIYLSVNVRPDGQVASDAKAALQKVLRTDNVDAKIDDALKKMFTEKNTSYSKDVEPWLGKQVGVFINKIDGANPNNTEYGIVAASSDKEKAKEGLSGDRKDAKERSFDGTKYYWDAKDEIAFVILDDYVVGGSEASIKSAITTVKNDQGKTLSDAQAYKDTRSAVANTSLGFGYFDVKKLIELSTQQAQAQGIQAAQQANQVLKLLGNSLPQSAGLSFDANGSRLRMQAVAIGGQQAATQAGDFGKGNESLKALPQDAWLALGFGDVGGSLNKGLEQIKQLAGPGGAQIDQGLNQIKQQFGIDVNKDIIDWMGSAGFFISGDSPDTIHAALVAQSKDPAATKGGLAKVQKLLKFLPNVKYSPLKEAGVDAGFTLKMKSSGTGAAIADQGVHVALAGDKFIVALGDESLKAAMNPSTKLGESPDFQSAAKELDGAQPAFYMNVTQFSKLIESMAGANSAQLAQVKPYLAIFKAFVVGAKTEGKKTTAAVALTMN